MDAATPPPMTDQLSKGTRNEASQRQRPRDAETGTPPEFPGGPGTRAAIGRVWLLPGLLLVLLVALFMRGQDLDRRALRPSEVEAMERAGLNHGEQIGAGSWASTVDLHAMVARASGHLGNRVGFSHVAALRLGGALGGGLAVLLIALALWRMAPAEPLTVLAGAGLAAVHLGSVASSRIGTGAAVSAALWFAAIIFIKGITPRAMERSRGSVYAGAAQASLLACTAVFVDPASSSNGVILAVLAIVVPQAALPGRSRWPWRSARGLALALVAALTIGAGAFLEPVQHAPAADPMQHLRALGIPLLFLVPLGCAGALTRDASWLAWLVLWGILSPLAAHGFGIAHAPLSELILPHLFLLLLAAEGLALLWGLSRHRIAVAMADLAAAGSVVWLLAVTWLSVFGSAEGPWGVLLP